MKGRLAVSLALLLSACASSAPPVPEQRVPDDFSLQLTHDAVWPMFTLTVEDVPVTALYDTGANANVLWDSATEVLGKLRAGQDAEVGGLGGDNRSKAQRFERLKVSFPTFNARPRAFAISWAATGLPEPAHGTFEMITPLLTYGGPANITVVDHERGVLEVYFDPARAPAFEDAFRLPLTRCDEGLSLLCATFTFETLEGTSMTLPMVIDTGSSGSVDIITDRWPENVELGAFQSAGAGVAGGFQSATGPDLYWIAEGERIGPIRSDTEERGATTEDVAGRIGSGFLNQTRYAVDRFNMELVIDRSVAEPGRLKAIKTYVRGISLGDWTGFLIIEPDELAPLGLHAGDIIRTIDGQPLATTYFQSAVDTLRSPGETDFCWDRPSTDQTDLCATFDAPE